MDPKSVLVLLFTEVFKIANFTKLTTHNIFPLYGIQEGIISTIQMVIYKNWKIQFHN